MPRPNSSSTHQTSPASDILTQKKGIWGVLDRGFVSIALGIALLAAAVLVWIGWIIFEKALPAVRQFGLGFLTSQAWDVGGLTFGALPYIYGSLVTSAIALLLALPLSIAVALVTGENFLPQWLRSPLAFVIELIAAIPSVIIGLWGIFTLIPVLQPIQLWLYQHIGQNPLFGYFPFNLIGLLFGTEPLGPSMLVAGVILAIMILPTIAAISREVLLAIPPELRTGSMALGATRWETIFRVLLPTAASGILGAAMLGLGRALGETMAVTMVIGNSTLISSSLLDPAYTIPAVLANEFAEAAEDLHIGALMYLALILFALTLAVNIAAVWIIRFLSPNQGRE
jgi:phosphate transport system permease protein